MFKRILCTLLTAVMVLTATPLAFAEGDITFPLVDEPLTLRFMAPRPSDYANGYADMKLLQEYEAKTAFILNGKKFLSPDGMRRFSWCSIPLICPTLSTAGICR